MAYSTLLDLKKKMPTSKIVQLSNDEGTGEIVDEVVDYCISQADNLIYTYTNGRYSLEEDDDETEVPAYIRDVSTKLARYYLYNRKLVETMPESLVEEYNMCIKVLEKIQDGDQSPFEDEPERVISNKDSSDKIFTSTVWSKYPRFPGACSC
jgi:phage gp36-like protein